jgi:hypothetical protein
MDKEKIQNAIEELNLLISKYKDQLHILEKELNEVISDYQRQLKEEKIKEIKKTLNI